MFQLLQYFYLSINREREKGREGGKEGERNPGVCRMKSLARGVVWWPGIDKDIENMVKGCHQCQVNCKSSAPAPWESPTCPWACIHIDHAGPFLGKQFLVLVDAYSKWLEVVPVPSLTSETTIRTLRGIFATHGLPELIVSDNGPSFTSKEFHEFVQRNGIRHVKCSPYHPASNGQAERAVQTFKEGLKKHSRRHGNSPGTILVPIQTNTTLKLGAS